MRQVLASLPKKLETDEHVETLRAMQAKLNLVIDQRSVLMDDVLAFCQAPVDSSGSHGNVKPFKPKKQLRDNSSKTKRQRK